MADEYRSPTYCTLEDVEETLDLPDPHEKEGYYRFSDVSHPKASRVEAMILSNEDQIDRRLHHSWRENRVVNHILNIPPYEKDLNGYRSEYYWKGGNVVQLQPYIREFDPSLGDKIELRTRMDKWVNVSEGGADDDHDRIPSPPTDGSLPYFRFDYVAGKLYVRSRYLAPKDGALRITYRYGDESPVPDAIRRLCCLMTATNVLNSQMFNIKVGSGGDISGVRTEILRAWQEEMASIWGSYQRIGRVRGLY